MLSLVALFCFLLPAQAVQTPSPAAAVTAAAPVEDPAVTALALKIYGQMRAGKVDSALLTDAMQKGLTPDVLAQTKPLFDQLGDPTRLALEKRDVVGDGTSYLYLATFPTAQFHVSIYVDKAGKVGGYRLLP